MGNEAFNRSLAHTSYPISVKIDHLVLQNGSITNALSSSDRGDSNIVFETLQTPLRTPSDTFIPPLGRLQKLFRILE